MCLSLTKKRLPMSCSNGKINVKVLTKNKIRSFPLIEVFKGGLLS